MTTDRTVTPSTTNPLGVKGDRRGRHDRGAARRRERGDRRGLAPGRHRDREAGIARTRLASDPGGEGRGVARFRRRSSRSDPGIERRGVMIPAAFDYERVDTVDAAIAALQADEGAKLLAGGHSLLPQMKLRFAMPTKLIDIGRLHDLSYVREDGGGVAIGALTRYHDLEASEELRQLAPDRGLRGRPGRRSAGPAHGDDRRLGRARRSGGRHAVGAARARCNLRGDGARRDAGDRGRRHVPGVVPVGARGRRGAHRDRVPKTPEAGAIRSSPGGPRIGPSWAWRRYG